MIPPASNCIDSTGNVVMNDSCVNANLAIQQENMKRVARYNSDPEWAQTFWDGSQPATPTYTAPSAPVVSSTGQTNTQTNVARGGSISFQNLSSGNGSVLKVGDHWRITISGATPNAPVSVSGGMNGTSATNAMGSTDANGNFSLTGTISADEVGSWAEQWYVGSQLSGSIYFTVPNPNADQAAAAAAAAAKTAADAVAAQAAATAAAKQAAADPTNPQAQAAAEQTKAAADAAAQKAANAGNPSSSGDNTTLYWIGGAVIGAGILYAMVNR
jgi:hypothetical protein